jgi:hypothetical protein
MSIEQKGAFVFDFVPHDWADEKGVTLNTIKVEAHLWVSLIYRLPPLTDHKRPILHVLKHCSARRVVWHPVPSEGVGVAVCTWWTFVIWNVTWGGWRGQPIFLKLWPSVTLGGRGEKTSLVTWPNLWKPPYSKKKNRQNEIFWPLPRFKLAEVIATHTKARRPNYIGFYRTQIFADYLREFAKLQIDWTANAVASFETGCISLSPGPIFFRTCFFPLRARENARKKTSWNEENGTSSIKMERKTFKDAWKRRYPAEIQVSVVQSWCRVVQGGTESCSPCSCSCSHTHTHQTVFLLN